MRLVQLDALRAFAIFLVFLEHFGGRPVNAFMPIGGGYLGVGLFFTLSGFLITGILLQSFAASPHHKGRVFANFYMRRFLRLLPPYYLLLFILVVVVGLEPITSSWPWHVSYLTNVWIALGNPMNVFWSLAVEEQFYLIWPFLIAFTPRRLLVPVTVAVIASATVFRLWMYLSLENYKDARTLLFSQTDLLGYGALLAVMCFRDGRANQFGWYLPQRERLFTLLAWIALGLAVLIWAVTGRGNVAGYFSYNLLVGIFFAWIVLHTARGWSQGTMRNIFTNPLLIYAGKISYGLYLVHNFVRPVLEMYIGPLPDMVAGPLVLTLTFGICMLSWHMFEQPILKLKRYFP